LNKAQHYKFAAIQWRNDHLQHCNAECNVSLMDLLQMAMACGAVFTDNEQKQFLSPAQMVFRP
jgi:hypothetical protein